MITTVATSAVTATAVALAAGTLGAVAVVALLLLLITRELSSAEAQSGSGGRRPQTLSRYVVIPIIPLLLVFAVIVAVKVWEVL